MASDPKKRIEHFLIFFKSIAFSHTLVVGAGNARTSRIHRLGQVRHCGGNSTMSGRKVLFRAASPATHTGLMRPARRG